MNKAYLLNRMTKPELIERCKNLEFQNKDLAHKLSQVKINSEDLKRIVGAW